MVKAELNAFEEHIPDRADKTRLFELPQFFLSNLSWQ